MTLFGLIGATALWLMYLWLLSAISASYLSDRKGYGEKPGLASGLILSIVGLILVRALFLEKALNQFYQANLIARIDYADILYIAPILLLVGVAMAGVTAYVTLRLYVRR